MQIFHIFTFAFMVAMADQAVPKSIDQAPASVQAERPQRFYLRANCPSEPWHGRSVVALPTSQRLGLENFTVAPTTLGLEFRPIQLPNGKYVLQGQGSNEEDANNPYLVALKPTNGTQITGMAILHIPLPGPGAAQIDVDACPASFECVADQWTFDGAGDDMIHPHFKFAGSEGNWEPVKDAAPEGWHVYWKAGVGLYHPIALDLVPADDHGCGGLNCLL